jgi:Heparinase II/III-like protein/Heparinase II/III N-terminus
MRSLPNIARWYRDRLAAMSFREALHRVAELALKIDGYRFNRDWNNIPAAGDLTTLPDLGDRWSSLPAGVKEIVAQEANDVRSRHFHLLSVNWCSPLSMPPDPSFWQRFPDAALWQGHDAYCFNVLARPRLNNREIKHIWEINRLQFIVPLAVDARLRDDAAGKKLVFDLIFSWMKGNAPYRGVNWMSGIELGLRTISVALAISTLGVGDLDRTELVALDRFFVAHAFWISRFPSLYSSKNNHRVAELAGLLVATTFVPGMKNAVQLRQRALMDLLNEIEHQILPDGIGAEQSLAYSAFMIELFLIALFTLKLRPQDLPPTITERLGAWADHVRWMMDGAGQVPEIGDCDESKVIALTQGREPRYVASIAAAIAGYLQREDLMPPRIDNHLRDVLFNSLSGNTAVGSGVRTWKHGGYTVIRARPAKPVVFVLDHGPLGYLSIAAHGHADTLAIWLSIGDEPVIVDAGTYVYTSDPIWHDRFRATALHNTLSIGGCSSSTNSGPFSWSSKAKGYLRNAKHEPYIELIAEHDGYLDRFSVYHRRTVRVVDGCSFDVIDELIGTPVNETIEVSFVINPTYRAHIDSGTPTAVVVEKGERGILRLSGNGALVPCIIRGDERMQLGWVSPTFGVRTPADQILFRGVLRGRSVIRIDPLQ